VAVTVRVRKPPTAEQKARKAALQRARNATPEGKAKLAAARKVLSPEEKAQRRVQQAAYRASAGYVTARRANRGTPEAKAQHAKYEWTRRLIREYGITVEQYDLILAAQAGRCAICLCVPRSRRLAVDHCHKSRVKGRLQDVRGLLCSRCNHDLLGAAHDKPEILDRAAAYLRHPPAPSALYAEEGTL
jgi:hypothetical protein